MSYPPDPPSDPSSQPHWPADPRQPYGAEPPGAYPQGQYDPQAGYPYPPNTLGYAAPQMMGFLDSSPSASVAAPMLLVYGLFALVTVGFRLVELVTFHGFADTDDLNPLELIEAGIGCIAFVFFVLAVVFYMVWQYRVAWNLHVSGLPMRVSPGWSVGWWFIPVANLYMPKPILEDIWTNTRRLSPEPEDEFRQGTNRGTVIYLFWITSILTMLGAIPLLFYAGFQENRLAYQVSMVILAISSLLSMLFYVFLARFVREVQKTQPRPAQWDPAAGQ